MRKSPEESGKYSVTLRMVKYRLDPPQCGFAVKGGVREYFEERLDGCAQFDA
jgi:hypothetical protein